MTAPTPEQMRALADENDEAAKVWGLRGFHTANAATLRAAADQLENYERDHNLVTREWHDAKMREVQR